MIKLIQTLNNKFVSDKQILELDLENELNSPTPDIRKTEKLLELISNVKLKQQLWDKYTKTIMDNYGKSDDDIG